MSSPRECVRTRRRDGRPKEPQTPSYVDRKRGRCSPLSHLPSDTAHVPLQWPLLLGLDASRARRPWRWSRPGAWRHHQQPKRGPSNMDNLWW